MRILSKLSFFSYYSGKAINKEYKNGVAFAFIIRKDMFNYGTVSFIDREKVYSGEKDVYAKITFAREDLVLPFLEEGCCFTFGNMSEIYGEGIIIKIY
jgi:hypothetical protein